MDAMVEQDASVQNPSVMKQVEGLKRQAIGSRNHCLQLIDRRLRGEFQLEAASRTLDQHVGGRGVAG